MRFTIDDTLGREARIQMYARQQERRGKYRVLLGPRRVECSTHEQAARLLGVHRVSVTRALRRDGWCGRGRVEKVTLQNARSA